MDIFKISLIFSEEFINLKLNDTNNSLSNTSFFNIIDTLYFQSIPQTVNINVNVLFNEYNENLKKNFKHFYLNENKSKRQLFVLDRKILNKFIYLLNNNYENQQIMELFPSVKLRTSDFIASIDQRSIKDVIKNYLINTKIISNYECIFYSVVYIFVMSLTLHSHQQLLIFLAEILHCFTDISMFVRYHINIILQSFHHYFLINMESNLFPEMNIDRIKIYFFYIGYYIRQKRIIPDKEMITTLSSFFGNKIIEERDKKIKENIEMNEKLEEYNDKNKENLSKIERNLNNNQADNNNLLSPKKEDIFKIKFKYNFHCFVKHSFNNNGIYSSKSLVKYAMNSSFDSQFLLKIRENLILTPIIVIKIIEYVNTSKILFPVGVFRNCAILFSDFSENFNYDLKKIDISKFRSLIINLIFYGLEMTEVKIPIDFLIYTLYALKDFEIKKEKK